MKTTFKSVTLPAILAVSFLSAGAFVRANETAPSQAAHAERNVTVINKTSQWPLKGQISTSTCAIAHCVEV